MTNSKNKTDCKKHLLKLLSAVLAILTMLTLFVACADKSNNNTQPTDEELIRKCVQTFITAYNEGDMDTALNCLNAKNRNAMEAILNLLGGAAGSYLGFDIDLKDLFSIGVSVTNGDLMKLNITDVSITSNSNGKMATVTTSMDLAGTGAQTVYFSMVYEHDGWYISDMRDTAQSSENGGTVNGDATTSYYVTTHSSTDMAGTAGTYTSYNRQQFDVGDTVILEATVKDGYNFQGWYITKNWNSVCLSTDLRYEYTMKAENVTIEAVYSYYTVTVGGWTDYDQAGTFTEKAEEKISVGDTVMLTATVNKGYNFEGWYRDGICLSKELTYRFEMKAESIEIEARYSSYILNVESWSDEHGIAGTYTKIENSKTSIGETVTLTATVNKGYNFEGWYRDGICLSKELTYSFEMKAEDVYIDAQYSFYTLTVDSWSNEHGAAGTYTKKEEEKISIGDTVTLTATVNKGYTFDGWFRDGVCLSKDLTYTFKMTDENIDIQAAYSYYTVTVYDIGSGWFDELKSSEKVSVGDEVSLVATNYNDFSFDGWYINGVCVSTDSTYIFSMSAQDIIIEAMYSYIGNE